MKLSYLQRLQSKWGITSKKQLWIVLLVFALTGTTIVVIKRPLITLLAGDDPSVWFYVGYYVLILPIYNVVLLGYGWLLGQFSFFWEYEKRMFSRMRRNKKASK